MNPVRLADIVVSARGIYMINRQSHAYLISIALAVFMILSGKRIEEK